MTLVQASTVWHDPAANREQLARMMHTQASATDLFILPETFTTGFSNQAVATAEGMDGATARWLLAQARALDAAITGSVQLRVGDRVFNRLLWAEPDGTLRHYDKRHHFRMAREQEHYAAGRERLVVEFRGWRICPLVCYDLRFPVFSRNRVRDGDVRDGDVRDGDVRDGRVRDAGARGGTTADAERVPALDFDLLLYVANWPAPRHDAWRTLLHARAIENLCYVAGVNRCGTDGNGHPYLGGSVLVDALGETLVECDHASQTVHHALSLSALHEQRRRFPAHLDADRFTLEE